MYVRQAWFLRQTRRRESQRQDNSQREKRTIIRFHPPDPHTDDRIGHQAILSGQKYQQLHIGRNYFLSPLLSLSIVLDLRTSKINKYIIKFKKSKT